MQELVVNAKNIAISQDSKELVSNIELKLSKGELVYLIGKVGSGKTSLIKTLYADLPLTKGSATVNGFELNNINNKDIPFLRRSLGIVFQDFKLLEDRNIHDNLRFVLEATAWKDNNKINNRIHEVLEEVGLLDKESKMPNELSGGEQQRVVIARALLNSPPLILADEPTGNLDPESSQRIMRILQSITLKGSCVLIATHQYDLIKEFHGRVLKIENNKIVEVDIDNM